MILHEHAVFIGLSCRNTFQICLKIVASAGYELWKKMNNVSSMTDESSTQTMNVLLTPSSNSKKMNVSRGIGYHFIFDNDMPAKEKPKKWDRPSCAINLTLEARSSKGQVRHDKSFLPNSFEKWLHCIITFTKILKVLFEEGWKLRECTSNYLQND